MSITKTQIKERAQLELLHCLVINEGIFKMPEYDNYSESEIEEICEQMQKQTTRIAKLFDWSRWELERFA